MGNFLTRMAARARGSAAVVQPVLPTVFTPGFGLAHPAPLGDGKPVSLQSEVEASVSLRTDLLSDGAESTFPRDRQPSVRTSRIQDATLPLATVSQGADAGAAALPLQELFAPIASMAMVEPLPAARQSAETEIPGDEIVHDASDSALATEREEQEPAMSGDGLVPAGLEGAPRVSVARRTDARPYRVDPMLPVVSRISSRRDQSFQTVAETPVVRVSIGRIDVRAQFPPAPPSPASTARPGPTGLTMEEYLKQRREGRR